MLVNPPSPGSLSSLSRSVSCIYCLLILCSYTVITITNFTNVTTTSHILVEPTSLLTFLLLGSCIYLGLIITKLGHHPHARTANHSHGSAFLRQGAIVFGAGTVLYFLIEMISLASHVKCVQWIKIFNSFLSIIFIGLQMVTVVLFPRLILGQKYGFSQLGLMHVVSTNLVIWVRTVIKESMLEVEEARERIEEMDNMGEEQMNNEHLSSESDHRTCKELHSLTSYVAQESSPILFAFIIEFALIGATVFFNTWGSVSDSPWMVDDTIKTIQKPHPWKLIQKTDFSNSDKGFIIGIMVLILNIVSLAVFFIISSPKVTSDEYVEKVTRSVTNSYGILSIVLGLNQIQLLKDRDNSEDGGMDSFLLNLSGFFSFIYMSFTVSVGIFAEETEGVPSHLHVVNGILDILSVCLQIIFIRMLLGKTSEDGDTKHSGRQMTTFLILSNLALWLVDTFELQKARASLVESHFYGPLTWVYLQRATLPLFIFFRFHSTVVLIDCWKNVYITRKEIETDENEMKSIK